MSRSGSPSSGALMRRGRPFLTPHRARVARVAIVAACGAAMFWTGPSVELDAQQPLASGACRITGRATSGGTPLPGVSVVVRLEDAVKTATSSDTDGTYRLTLPA